MIEAPAVPDIALWQADRYQLWSLLDMLRFYGATFVAAVTELERARVNVLFGEQEEEPKHLKELSARLEALTTALKELPVSKSLILQATRLQQATAAADWRTLHILVSELQLNLVTELTEHLFLVVPASDKWTYLEPEKWWGPKVMATFGLDAGTDLRDAARCLALAQWTASVFHGMRVMEHGLRSLATRVGAAFSSPMELENWKNIIDQIEKEIRKQEQLPKSQTKSQELQFCSNAAAQFWYTKEAWRNHVSHSRTTYDEAGATKVIEHVRDFMAALA